MGDKNILETNALQQLLESIPRNPSKRTFQEKFKRFDETKLLNWEEEGQSETSLISMKQKQEKNYPLSKVISPEKKHQTPKLQSLQLRNSLKNLQNKPLQTESDFSLKSKPSIKTLNALGKEKTSPGFFIDKNRFSSPDLNPVNGKGAEKCELKPIKVSNKMALQLKLVSPADRNSDMLFLNDFNIQMLKNRKNFSPSNFSFLNFENKLITKNSLPGTYCKHTKVKSLGKNNFVTSPANRCSLNNILGVIESRKTRVDHPEKDTTYKVLHSLNSMKFFNININ